MKPGLLVEMDGFQAMKATKKDEPGTPSCALNPGKEHAQIMQEICIKSSQVLRQQVIISHRSLEEERLSLSSYNFMSAFNFQT